jgi:lipopolysaccharide/colanic/teichoic acid biosynthesis glycosyltransferase
MNRPLEFTLTLVLGTLISPFIILIAMAVLLVLGRPIFFRQERAGLHGVVFSMLKFRTMKNDVDSSGVPLPDSLRINQFGRFLRNSSLDELPELWNVLRGEMSLVGPRPLLTEYLPLYTPEQARRHEVKPGITGWAQVNGRNAISWEDKFRLDVWYVENKSLFLDMRIIWLTLGRLICRDNINADGHASMPKFTGSRSLDQQQ